MANTRVRNTALSGNPPESHLKKISDCLEEFTKKLRITAVLLVNSRGEQVAQKASSTWKIEASLLAPLTASSLLAAGEMARILEEKTSFQMILHEGRRHSILVSSINRDFFLVVIFKAGTAQWRVKQSTKKSMKKPYPVLSRWEQDPYQMKHMLDSRFHTRLNEAPYQSFKEFS